MLVVGFVAVAHIDIGIIPHTPSYAPHKSWERTTWVARDDSYFPILNELAKEPQNPQNHRVAMLQGHLYMNLGGFPKPHNCGNKTNSI